MMKLFINANLYKRNEDSFITKNDEFFEFGNKDSLLNKYEYEEVIDLNNKFVYPGFNDSHMHLLNYGLFLSNISLYEHTNSITELKDYLKSEIKDLKANSFVRCRGFNQDYFVEKRMLSKSDLDEVSKDVAIVAVRACGHIAVVNSKLIELLGFKDDQKVDMGSFNLETGVFEEFGLNEIFERMPSPTIDELKAYIIKGAKALNKYGITSCQSDDFEVFPNTKYEDVIKAYTQLAEEGKLTVRVNEQAQLKNIDLLNDYIHKGYNNIKGKFFRSGPLKLIGDGSLGARTAYLSKTYNDDNNNRGTILYTQEQMDELVSTADKNNMGVAVHCIGDGTLDVVLNSFKNVIKDTHNPKGHGIVHIQVTRPDQIKDMIKYNIRTYVQTIFIDYDAKIVYQRLGEQLANTSYQFKTYLDNGLVVSNGSDGPVEMPDVLKGMECGVTRCPIGISSPYLKDQCFSIDEIIDTYTINGAKQSFEENYKGKLEKSYLADFVILDNDLEKVDKTKIHDVKVLATYLGANRV